MPSQCHAATTRDPQASPSSRRLMLAVLAALCLPATVIAQLAPWPSRPITLVVGNAPGGSNDVFARAIGRRLQEALGQPVVVDNKPAGGGVTGKRWPRPPTSSPNRIQPVEKRSASWAPSCCRPW